MSYVCLLGLHQPEDLAIMIMEQDRTTLAMNKGKRKMSNQCKLLSSLQFSFVFAQYWSCYLTSFIGAINSKVNKIKEQKYTRSTSWRMKKNSMTQEYGGRNVTAQCSQSNKLYSSA